MQIQPRMIYLNWKSKTKMTKDFLSLLDFLSYCAKFAQNQSKTKIVNEGYS